MHLFLLLNLHYHAAAAISLGADIGFLEGYSWVGLSYPSQAHTGVNCAFASQRWSWTFPSALNLIHVVHSGGGGASESFVGSWSHGRWAVHVGRASVFRQTSQVIVCVQIRLLCHSRRSHGSCEMSGRRRLCSLARVASLALHLRVGILANVSHDCRLAPRRLQSKRARFAVSH